MPLLETPPAVTKLDVTPRQFIRPFTEVKLPTTPPPPPLPRPVELPTKSISPIETNNLEPIPPPVSTKAKIAPIDLRQESKPRPLPSEFMRGAIFVAPRKSEEKLEDKPPIQKPVVLPETPAVSTQPTPEKKTPGRGLDQYRESVE
jgi:hypothetical protein